MRPLEAIGLTFTAAELAAATVYGVGFALTGGVGFLVAGVGEAALAVAHTWAEPAIEEFAERPGETLGKAADTLRDHLPDQSRDELNETVEKISEAATEVAHVASRLAENLGEDTGELRSAFRHAIDGLWQVVAETGAVVGTALEEGGPANKALPEAEMTATVGAASYDVQLDTEPWVATSSGYAMGSAVAPPAEQPQVADGP